MAMNTGQRGAKRRMENDLTRMTLHSHPNTGIPGPRPAPAVPGRVTCAAKTRPSIVKPIALDRANLLCIRDGRGTRVRVTSGVLWVTEENSPEDHMLLPGDAVDFARKGTAIVFAHRSARIVIELPPGVAPPRAVELAEVVGERRRRIALAVSTPTSRSTIVTGIATVIGNALASIRTFVTTLRSRWDAA